MTQSGTRTPLPSPYEVQTLLPRSPIATSFILDARQQAKGILAGTDSRMALIVGPCSIHNLDSALAYGEKIRQLAERVKESCFLVMRVYIEKPRTSVGWKGFLYDPHLDASCDVKTGILWTRDLFLQLAKMGVPCAAEFVDPLAALYFEDFLTWGFIGARTCASQPHRQFASQLDLPIGFKNSTEGHLQPAIHGIQSASTPHACLHIDLQGQLCAIQSQGNPYSHLVLRGSDQGTNYSSASIAQALDLLQTQALAPRLMIDCSHGNTQKNFLQQQEVLLSVLEQRTKNVFGFMLESHLEEGNQILTDDPSSLKTTVSITDPCLDWATTEALIESAHEHLSTHLQFA